MQQLYYELSVLSKCIKYKNLTAASSNVGLSQPQLSRIVSKIENELNIVLLDRNAKRKSGWTQAAFRLSDIFYYSTKKLELELVKFSNIEKMSFIRIGCLEGLADLAIEFTQYCVNKLGVKEVHLNVYDLHYLESEFLSDHLDLIFTSKLPGKLKYTNTLEFGYQSFDHQNKSATKTILSTFEFNHLHKKSNDDSEQIIISNSLYIKQKLIDTKQYKGNIPSGITNKKTESSVPVLLLSAETIHPKLWNELVEFKRPGS